ncbi:MAG: superinfection immunity protein [Candidatus Kaiserbacteria bacterium]|nr:superinfection immunity protein [Candidatus Kaiserbacteria bacterium]
MFFLEEILLALAFGYAMYAIGIFGGILICTTMYVLPIMIALLRSHTRRRRITVITLCLGWTFVGWVWALIWACTDNTEKKS